MAKGTKLQQHNDNPIDNPEAYRRLLYLTTTRPDLSYAVQQLSQFVAAPTNMSFTLELKEMETLLFNVLSNRKILQIVSGNYSYINNLK